jgi:hypothetical protein
VNPDLRIESTRNRCLLLSPFARDSGAAFGAGVRRAHFLGLRIGTSQSILPVGADLIRRTPPIALSGAFSAFSASVRNGWPRRRVSGTRTRLAARKNPPRWGSPQPRGTDCASALKCQAFSGEGAGGFDGAGVFVTQCVQAGSGQGLLLALRFQVSVFQRLAIPPATQGGIGASDPKQVGSGANQPVPVPPALLPTHSVAPPDTHRRFNFNLRCVSGGATEGIRCGAGGLACASAAGIGSCPSEAQEGSPGFQMGHGRPRLGNVAETPEFWSSL